MYLAIDLKSARIAYLLKHYKLGLVKKEQKAIITIAITTIITIAITTITTIANNDSVEVVSRIEQRHVCNPKVVASNRKEVLDKEGSVKKMVDKLPANSINVTKWWIENQKNSCYSLIAIKIPHKKKNNDNDNEDNIADNGGDNIQPEQEHIKIPNPKNPKQQITFQYSKEKHINLSLRSNENTKNHYAARAIIYGHTILTNEWKIS
jgi:hypothetical protein